MSIFCTKTTAVLLLAMFFAGCGDSDQYDYHGSLNVTGSGTAYAEPDVASIEFGVDITEKDPAEAVDHAAEMMDAAFAAASEYGISKSDMKAISYNMWVEEEYDYNTYEYTGETLYHVSHYAQVDIRDLDSVGEVHSLLKPRISAILQTDYRFTYKFPEFNRVSTLVQKATYSREGNLPLVV